MKPLIIGLEGVSCAGKTELARQCYGEFECLSEIQETSAYLSDGAQTARWFLETNIKRARLASQLRDTMQKNTILDRTHLSTLAFNYVCDLLENKQITLPLIREFSQELEHPQYYPDLFIYIQVSTPTAMDRIRRKYTTPHPIGIMKNLSAFLILSLSASSTHFRFPQSPLMVRSRRSLSTIPSKRS